VSINAQILPGATARNRLLAVEMIMFEARNGAELNWGNDVTKLY